MDIASRINQLLEVSSTDPDDARRRKLLNVLLLGVGMLAFVALLLVVVADFANVYSEERIASLYQVGIVFLIGIAVIFALNRHSASWLASVLFLLLFTIILGLSDEPQELVQGRSLIVFTIPVVIASVVLPPAASFAMASVSALTVLLISFRAGISPSPFGILVFFVVAIASWLSARSLEHALSDLRVLNQELDRRVAQRTQELAEALSRNQAILEGIADGVIVFDNDGTSTVANPAMARLLERSPEEILGQDIDALLANEQYERSDETLTDLLQTREGSASGLKLEWGEKVLSVSFAPVRDSGGAAMGTVAVFRDFTREAEIDRMKSAFVSMASHELRTPLNAILGYVDMLQEGVYGRLTDKQHSVLERIIANVGELLNIVNNLLDQAQIEAGKLVLNPAPFSPADLIDGVQGVMTVLAHAKGLKLTSYVAADIPPTLVGDRQRLYEIVVNLVSNAIKFTDKGSVHIRAFRPDENHWALEVADTGCGIPRDAQTYIFEPFRRVDDSATRETMGVGLGLSIVKQLATLMGGDIALKSEVGQGSKFTVILPLIVRQEALWATDSR